MPKDNIERAIKRGTGELEGVTYEQVNYEGYAPNGVAVYVETLTDNRNRTGSEVKNVVHPQRWLARRAGRGELAVRAQGRDPARQGRGVRGRPHARGARGRRRGHRGPGRHLAGHDPADRAPRRCASALESGRHPVHQHRSHDAAVPDRSTHAIPARRSRCCGSSTRSRSTTTCRTSTPTSTSPTTCSPTVVA